MTSNRRAVYALTDHSAGAMRRLALENTRLKTLCAESIETIARLELLLREGDHRIKNSLQVVVGLLSVQARRETNKATRDMLQAATARIQAVASIHDALQLSGGADAVDLGALISTMCRSLHAMAGDLDAIKIVVDAEQTQTPLSVAQPVVLAINELVINALRHAFPDERHGAVLVTLQHMNGGLRITIADDGIGLPADYCEGHGYGMKLVSGMVAKVGGTFEAQSNAGARFTMSLPAKTLAHSALRPRQLLSSAPYDVSAMAQL